MIFALSGVQCSGKTTTLLSLRSSSYFANFQFLYELARDLKGKGFKINEEGNDTTQLAVMSMHLVNLLKSKDQDAVVDRCLLDGYVYSLYHKNHNEISDSTFNLVQSLYRENIRRYERIFLMEPLELVEDGVRSTSEEYHEEIEELFNKVTRDDKLGVVRIPAAPVQERANIITGVVLETIDSYSYRRRK